MLDQDGDGLTDSPPFLPGGVDPRVLEPAIPAEVMIPVVTHYTVAFLKVFLEGDDKYMKMLEPKQAKHVGPVKVTIIED